MWSGLRSLQRAFSPVNPSLFGGVGGSSAVQAGGAGGRWQQRQRRSVSSEARQRFKLVATDLDGTFMRDTGQPPWVQSPSERNIAAVDELMRRNIYFVLISGRMIVNMAPLLHSMGDRVARNRSTFIAGYNGGVIVGPPTSALDRLGESRTTLIENTLPDPVIGSAVEYAEKEGLLMKVYYRQNGMCAMASCGDFDYDEEQAKFFFGCGEFAYPFDHEISVTRLDDGMREQLQTSPFEISRVERDAEAIAALRPHKLVVLTDDPDRHMAGASKMLSGLRLKKNAKINPDEHLVRGNFWFEYMPAAVNKSTALAQLAASLGFTLDECVAFGDSSNDFEMLRDAGMGVAMANAREEVKAVATYTSGYTNEDDGVGREIEYMIEKGVFHEW